VRCCGSGVLRCVRALYRLQDTLLWFEVDSSCSTGLEASPTGGAMAAALGPVGTGAGGAEGEGEAAALPLQTHAHPKASHGPEEPQLGRQPAGKSVQPGWLERGGGGAAAFDPAAFQARMDALFGVHGPPAAPVGGLSTRAQAGVGRCSPLETEDAFGGAVVGPENAREAAPRALPARVSSGVSREDGRGVEAVAEDDLMRKRAGLWRRVHGEGGTGGESTEHPIVLGADAQANKRARHD
jgi:hypothetical protein